MTETADLQAPRSNRTLWLLILTFAVPIVFAYAYFFFVDDYSLGNHGDLINPVVQIEDLGLADSDGNVMTRDQLVHNWKMLFIAGPDCNPECQQTIYYMRQINTALGKNADRFQHMVIHLDSMSPEFSSFMSAEHTAALHSYTSSEKLSTALSGIDGAINSNSIYIMDPLGNIMMRFSYGTSPKLILKDLNRLLKISRIG